LKRFDAIKRNSDIIKERCDALANLIANQVISKIKSSSPITTTTLTANENNYTRERCKDEFNLFRNLDAARQKVIALIPNKNK
jgi:hypothetical protein